ncbi:MAG: MFS transporter, partial [Sphingomicrobium sp.]
VAEGLLFVFLYYALRRLSGGELSLARYALTAAAAQLVAIPVALAVGRWSDRHDRRRGPLLLTIALIASGLATMAAAGNWTLAVIGYALFLIGSNSFLSLHSTFAMQQLRDPRRHGRDLGLFNLTNTLPALVTPLIAVRVIGAVGYSGLLAGLAVAMVVPALLVARLDLR